MTSWFFFLFHTPATKKRGYTILALSVLPSVPNIFRRTFLDNHASQPLQTWYDALTRGSTRHLPNSGPPVIYFLFPGSVHFLSLHLRIAGLYSVSKNSQISWVFFFFFSPNPHILQLFFLGNLKL